MTKIIAEIGVNHNGIIQRASKLVKLAKKAGADYVKLQIYTTNLLVTNYARKSKYQKKTSLDFDNQYKMLKKYELSLEEHKKIIKYCKRIKINYCASVFDVLGLNFLIKNRIKIIKIPSGEITNKFLLEELKKFKGLVLLSTGMSTLDEVTDAVNILKRNKNKFNLFYCCSSYPAPLKEIDMNILLTLKKKYKCPVGYSDHTKDNYAAILATLMGATFVEKHFTDNKKLSGPDHRASSDFKQLKQLTNKINIFNDMLKSGIKIVTKSEIENRVNSRKSIVAKNLILKDQKFSKKNLTFKRPGDGISPMKINSLLGQKAKKTFLRDEQIKI